MSLILELVKSLFSVNRWWRQTEGTWGSNVLYTQNNTRGKSLASCVTLSTDDAPLKVLVHLCFSDVKYLFKKRDLLFDFFTSPFRYWRPFKKPVNMFKLFWNEKKGISINKRRKIKGESVQIVGWEDNRYMHACLPTKEYGEVIYGEVCFWIAVGVTQHWPMLQLTKHRRIRVLIIDTVWARGFNVNIISSAGVNSQQ